MRKTNPVPDGIPAFIKLYGILIAFFTLFRLVLFLTEITSVHTVLNKQEVLLSFLMGLRFDVVISGYILLLPFALVSLAALLNYRQKAVLKFSFYYTAIISSLALLVCAIDIPYFNQYFARFSITGFEWLDSPAFMFKMIAEEPRYWLVIIPLIVCIYFFVKVTKNIFRKISQNPDKNIFPAVAFYLLFLFLMLIGIRGRLEQKSPIRIGTAYFCNNAFLNQLGLNPNFTLIRSYLDSRKNTNDNVKLMDDGQAIENVQHYLHIDHPDDKLPLLRKIMCDSSGMEKHNVILIIMESMSAAKMTRHGNENNLTPFLDSLSKEGCYFENTYTSGIHTFNGIFSSLFSFPALFRQHPMKESCILKFHGIFSALKEHDYSTAYFTTHDDQFDNVGGFLRANDCETLISKSDYPAEQVKTTLGVPDDYMFEYAVPILNKLHAGNKPFFAAFMTASDHGPYYIPPYFKPKNSAIKNQIVEYADYSLRKFMDLSSQQEWFKNTLFVFVADHGAALDGLYDMSLTYNHAPLLFYAPEILKEHKTLPDMAGQIDIFPSIMGLLKMSYDNNTLGVDLFKESRPYIFFNADDKYGVIDHDWFLIARNDNSKSLYKYQNKDTHNYATERPDILELMDRYAKSNLQAYQYVIRTNKQ